MSEAGSTRGLSPVFDIYGFRFRVGGDAPDAIDGIAQDYEFFRTAGDAECHVEIEVSYREPDYDSLPECDATLYTPRNVVYDIDERRYLDFGGRGLAVYDRKAGRFHIVSRDGDLLYEAAYLFLLSRIGEFLDRRRLHRLHALAVAISGRAVLVPLPSGGGKSTLGMNLLRYPEVKILSDDSPFIDRRGGVHAYPLRLGLLSNHRDEIPADQRREIRRIEFDPKVIANYSYFADRVVPRAEPGLLLIGRRSMSGRCRLERVGVREGMRTMMSDCVVGLGLYQGIEFLLRRSAFELLSNIGPGWSRFRNALALVRRSRVYKVHLGRDSAANARAIMELAHQSFGKAE